MPARLLIVDDEQDMREMLQFHLASEGYAVDMAADGPAALAALEAGAFDLVLLDMNLPRLSGAAVLAEVRRRWPGQLVISLASSIDPHDVAGGAPHGDAGAGEARANAHLRKPFTLEELADAVRGMLAPPEAPALASAGPSRSLAPRAAPLARAAILVIDDEQDMRDMLAFELSQDGFEVETASSGLAAIEALSRRKFDLAVTDLKMPGMDGVQTVAALKKIDPDLEIIVATGYATVETAVACIRNGAYDYIRKPYELQDLRQLLERALERSKLQGSVALFEASRALLGTLEHDDLVAAVIAPATRILGADGVGLILDGPDAPPGPPVSGGAQPPDRAVLAWLAARAARSGGPLRLPAEGEAVPPELARAGYSSVLAYRLVSRDQPLGVLALLRRQGAVDFAGSELQRGGVFASQVAMALDNARLYSALGEQLRELLATRDQLVRSQKLNLASKLAGGVAHEINNPLAAVNANLGALRGYSSSVRSLWAVTKGVFPYLRSRTDPVAAALHRRLEEAVGNESQAEMVFQDIDAIVDETLEAVRRITELVSGFTHLSGPDESHPARTFDVGELVAGCVATLPATIKGERPPLVYDGPTGIAATASPEDVRVAVTNLLAYALEEELGAAGALAGRVEIRAALDGGHPIIRIRAPHLQVPADERSELFDPRIDVRADSGPTLRLDIRLPLAHQLLDRTGATLGLEDCPGGGLQFLITLPSASAPSLAPLRVVV